MKSQFLRLNLKDVLRGIAITVITAIIAGLAPVLQAGKIPTLAELKIMAIAGISAGIAYLGKNLLTNSADEFGKAEVPPPIAPLK